MRVITSFFLAVLVVFSFPSFSEIGLVENAKPEDKRKVLELLRGYDSDRFIAFIDYDMESNLAMFSLWQKEDEIEKKYEKANIAKVDRLERLIDAGELRRGEVMDALTAENKALNARKKSEIERAGQEWSGEEKMLSAERDRKISQLQNKLVEDLSEIIGRETASLFHVAAKESKNYEWYLSRRNSIFKDTESKQAELDAKQESEKNLIISNANSVSTSVTGSNMALIEFEYKQGIREIISDMFSELSDLEEERDKVMAMVFKTALFGQNEYPEVAATD